MRELSVIYTDRGPWARIAGALCLLALAASCLPAAGAGGEKLTPKSVPIQMKLGEEMTANEDWEEATRRWIDILYYFGPSDQDARAEFELGAIALHRGRSDLAIFQWQKTATRHPDSEWAARAREGLRLLSAESPAGSPVPVEPYVTTETPPDERQFLCAQGDAAAGFYEFAIRDYLKITNLYPDSERAPEARFQIGTSQALLGHPERAIEQWERVIQDYPDSPQAEKARLGAAAWRAVLKIAGAGEVQARNAAFEAEWRPFRRYVSDADRGLSYAEDLFENGIHTYALQEYAKVLLDLYTPEGGENPHKAYARYRMGVSAYRLGERDAAARQWRRLIADFPDSPWSDRANRALAAVGITDPFSSDSGRPAPAVPEELPSQLVQRLHLGNQLVDCGLPLMASKEYLKVMFVLTAGKPNPFQAEACFKLGVTQHLRGRPDLALGTWRRVMEEYPNTPWAEEAEAAVFRAQQREEALSQNLTPTGGPSS